MKGWKFFFFLAVLCALNAHAEAKSWTIDYANSRLGFTGAQGTKSFQGSFGKFTVTTDFDPDHPESSKIAATIDVTTIRTGDGERDSLLPQSDWFDTSKFPVAQFESAKIKKTGINTYEAAGSLTIKGLSKTVILPFTFTQEGDHWRALGKTLILRNDYNIGQGQWANEDGVKFNVDVTFDVVARPAA